MAAALELLPAELWDIVFDLGLSNDDLLSLAQVCHTFNGFCIARYLMRHGVSLDALLSATHWHASLSAETLVGLALQ